MLSKRPQRYSPDFWPTYYKKSKTIRLNKFSKDLKGHCIKIKLDRKLDYDIYFSVNKIKQITEKYNQKVKDNNRNLTNDKNKYYWLRGVH